MLRSLLHPILALLFAASSYFAYSSAQAAQPLNIAPSAVVGNLTGGAPTQSQAAQNPPPPVEPARLPDVDAIVVLDHSGSMRGTACNSGAALADPATDPDDLRVKAAQVVIAGLAADLDPRQTSLGIVTFGDSANVLRNLTPLSNEDSRVRDELSAAVENPPCLGDTNIVDAFRRAAAELQSERATEGNTPAIIFLTDGANTVGSNSDIARILDDLGEVRIFVALLGGRTEQSFWQEQGEQRPNMRIYTLDRSEQLPELYRDITAELNFTPDYANAPALPPGQTVTVEVPPNVKQVVMTAIKRSPTVSLTITTPNGADARALDADSFRALTSRSPVEVFVINRPAPGPWTFQVPADEMLTVLRPEFKSIYQVQLLQPDSAGLLSVDQVTDITVQVVDIETAATISETLKIAGEYVGANGSVTPLTFQAAAASSQYTAQVPASAFAEGQTYSFTFNASDDRGLMSQPAIYQIAAGRLPILLSASVAPESNINEPVQIAARVANTDVISGPATLRLVQMIPGMAAPTFDPVDANNYVGSITFDRPGNYTLQLAYSGTTTSGRAFSSVRSFSITVTEPAWMPIARWLAVVVATLTACYFLFRFLLLRLLIPLFQRLKLSPQGYVRITPPGQKHPYPEASVTNLLRNQRKLFRLTVGVGSGFDIMLEEDPQKLNDPEYLPPKPTLRERLFGRRPLGSVRVRNGSTMIEVGASSRTFPKQAAASLEGPAVNDNLVEVSLNSMDDTF
jgi:uncharacterized protein YegL